MTPIFVSCGRHPVCPRKRQFVSFVTTLFLVLGIATADAQTWEFTDVTQAAGVFYTHGYSAPDTRGSLAIATGVAAGDYDKDGWVDLYVVRGDIGANRLFRNLGDGTFEDVAVVAGVALTSEKGSGPLFADLNGDGWLDLFVGGIEETTPTLFLNNADGTFIDVTGSSGIDIEESTFSASAGDYDRDGDLDLFLTHWKQPLTCNRLWQNNGDATFVCVDDQAGVHDPGIGGKEYSFTANFADINSDGWPDLLVSGDFTTSRIYMNDGRDAITGVTTFTRATQSVITDENGMGGAIGDYDNDGDLDWFVSSIFDANGTGPSEPWGITGNRLYRNSGDGTFEDATDLAGVREGEWGWGSSFADFNNDGHLDLYHVNGWPFATDFLRDPAPLFVSNGDGTFTDRAVELGADHLGQGRGIVCFDYDRDGDLDIFVACSGQPSLLLRNDGGNNSNYLAFKLRGNGSNIEAIGARVFVTVGFETQMRELKAGCNFVSQDPAEAHFGLGLATQADVVRIVWPDGIETALDNVPANQLLTVDYPRSSAPVPVFEPRIVDASPNPFSATVSIGLELPGETTGVVRIYDVAGRLVQTLAFGNVNGQSATVSWNGLDRFGNRVASGVYMARIETPRGSSESKRITILR